MEKIPLGVLPMAKQPGDELINDVVSGLLHSHRGSASAMPWDDAVCDMYPTSGANPEKLWVCEYCGCRYGEYPTKCKYCGSPDLVRELDVS